MGRNKAIIIERRPDWEDWIKRPNVQSPYESGDNPGLSILYSAFGYTKHTSGLAARGKELGLPLDSFDDPIIKGYDS